MLQGHWGRDDDLWIFDLRTTVLSKLWTRFVNANRIDDPPLLPFP